MKIYFASDAHLGARFHKDPLAIEKKLVRWLDSIKEDASAIWFLGDLFDYWYEYKYVVPKGHVRFLGKLAELADRGIEIHIFIGNHDIWMFDYLPKEIGIPSDQGYFPEQVLPMVICGNTSPLDVRVRFRLVAQQPEERTGKARG